MHNKQNYIVISLDYYRYSLDYDLLPWSIKPLCEHKLIYH